MKARTTKHGEVSKKVPVKRLEQECPQKIRSEAREMNVQRRRKTPQVQLGGVHSSSLHTSPGY